MSALVPSRLRRVAERFSTVCRRVLGAPDYEAYVGHLALAHPGVRPLERKDFERKRMDARYSRPGAKCC